MSGLLVALRWLCLTQAGRVLLLVALLLAVAWWALDSAYDRGREDERGAQAAAVAKAQADQRAAEIARDNLANAIADETEREAREASQQTQAQASEARERIRTVIREVKADCPQVLPEAIQNELHTGIDRANEANR